MHDIYRLVSTEDWYTAEIQTMNYDRLSEIVLPSKQSYGGKYERECFTTI